MTGEKKSSDLSSRLSVKSGKKLLSKTSKPSPSTISSPPKAAISTSTAKKEEVHRRRHAFNDILRRRSGDGAVNSKDTPSVRDVERGDTAPTEADAEAEQVEVGVPDRAAELEEALAIAKERQDELKGELDKLKGLRQLDKGTIEELKDETARVQQDVAEDSAMADADPPANSEPMHSRTALHEDLLRQNYDLRYKLTHLQDQLVSQDLTHRNNLEQALSHDDELNDLRSRLHATEKKSQERLQQLLSLKSSISSLTRTDAQVTDSELAEAFDQLANRIREWVISNFRRSKLDVGDLPTVTVKALRSLTPAYDAIESTDRLALYQAIVSSALMKIFDEPIVLGLSESGSLSAISSFAENVRDDGAEYRDWRRATIRVIEASAAREKLEQGKKTLLHRIAAEIAHVFFTLTAVNLTQNAQAALMGILNTAADLQRTLALQKAQYRVLFCRISEVHRNVNFDEKTMESINDVDNMVDDEDEEAAPRSFLFCVFPYLEKFGDEWGEQPEISNVLLKARVCCGVG